MEMFCRAAFEVKRCACHARARRVAESMFLFVTRGEVCVEAAVCLPKSLSALNLSAGEVSLRAMRMYIDPHCQLPAPGPAHQAGPDLREVRRSAGRAGGNAVGRALRGPAAVARA